VRIAEAHTVAEHVPYDELVKCIIECTVRGALARTVDESEWEQEELRRKGLAALQIFRDGKAIWTDSGQFSASLDEARRTGNLSTFEERNELDTTLLQRIDRDLRARWGRAGYRTLSLIHNMGRLFKEIERDTRSRAADAREGLAAELFRAMF
jgi:hypothetical protein